MWTETVLNFSHEHTRVADALTERLKSLNVSHEVLPSRPRPPREEPALLRKVT